MIGLAIFATLALLGGGFMVFVLVKFQMELKRPKRTRLLLSGSDLDEWRTEKVMSFLRPVQNVRKEVLSFPKRAVGR
jgi:hypothetical protein